MRMIERVGRPIAYGLATLAWCCTPAAAAEAELDKVRDMLRIDTERALAAERARQAPAARAAPAPVRRSDRIDLSSLYGLKGALSAVVLVNGEPRFYRQGSELPRGALAAAQEYRLLRIDDGCVYLRKGTKERSACFVRAEPGPAAPADRGAPASLPAPAMLPVLAVPPGVRP